MQNVTLHMNVMHDCVKTLIDILAHLSPSFSRNFDIFVLKITDLNVNTSIFRKGSHVLRNETWSLCNSI